jgi:hypothetical protein
MCGCAMVAQQSPTGRRRRLLSACAASPPAMRVRLDAAGNQQHNDDYEQQAESAARVITPAAAVRPSRQCPDQQQDQDDEKDGAEHRVTRNIGSSVVMNPTHQSPVPVPSLLRSARVNFYRSCVGLLRRIHTWRSWPAALKMPKPFAVAFRRRYISRARSSASPRLANQRSSRSLAARTPGSSPPSGMSSIVYAALPLLPHSQARMGADVGDGNARRAATRSRLPSQLAAARVVGLGA